MSISLFKVKFKFEIDNGARLRYFGWVVEEPTDKRPTAAIKAEPRSSETRTQLLHVAGEIFAEKGVDRTTSKEICDRAHVNPAAVNYHFGGVDGLYSAAVSEAHRHLMQLETLTHIVSGEGTPEHRLKTIIEIMVAALTSQSDRAWQFKLLGREIVAPSGMLKSLIETQILPKIRILRYLIAEILVLDPDHPAVGRCVLSIVAPCLLLAIGDQRVLETLVPALFDADPETTSIATHLFNYAMAGLSSAAAEAKRQA